MGRRLLSEHLGLMLSTLAAATIVVKIWSVAHGGMPAITAIVGSGSGLSSVLGALLAGLPVLGTVPLLFTSSTLGEAIREGDNLRGPVIAAVVSLALALILAPVAWLVIVVVLGVGQIVFSVLVVLQRRRHKKHGRKPSWFVAGSDLPRNDSPVLLLMLLACLAWLAVVVSDTPWLPAEDIATVHDGIITGYVLDADGGTTLVLTARDRTVTRIPNDEVKERIVCAHKSTFFGLSPTRDTATDDRSLLSVWLWQDAAEYPSCVE